MDDARDTVDRLCTLAGMIMEDTVSTAVASNAQHPETSIAMISAAGRDLVALADAASVISARWILAAPPVLSRCSTADRPPV